VGWGLVLPCCGTACASCSGAVRTSAATAACTSARRSASPTQTFQLPALESCRSASPRQLLAGLGRKHGEPSTTPACTHARTHIGAAECGHNVVGRRCSITASGRSGAWVACKSRQRCAWGCIAPLPFPAASSLRYARKSKCSRTAPLQVLFSLLNLAAHVHGLRRTWALAPTPPSPRAGGPVPSGSRGWCASYAVNPAGQSPCLELPALRRHRHTGCACRYLALGLVSANAWWWAAVFHMRDCPLTEALDYHSATAVQLASAACACVADCCVAPTHLSIQPASEWIGAVNPPQQPHTRVTPLPGGDLVG
jgi:hypothetical protein